MADDPKEMNLRSVELWLLRTRSDSRSYGNSSEIEYRNRSGYLFYWISVLKTDTISKGTGRCLGKRAKLCVPSQAGKASHESFHFTMENRSEYFSCVVILRER